MLRGDRGLTYAEAVPDGSTVTKGAWWPADYTGEPLVSLEQEIAGLLKLKVGDTMTVNVLGRNITARIANLREVGVASMSGWLVAATGTTRRDAGRSAVRPKSLASAIRLRK